MGMIKKGSTTPAPVAAAPAVATAPVVETPKQTDSGTAAAISRLKKTEPAAAGTGTKAYVGQTGGVDDAKSERILRQGAYQHALVSPALAGMKFENMDEYIALVEEAAEKTIAKIKGK